MMHNLKFISVGFGVVGFILGRSIPPVDGLASCVPFPLCLGFGICYFSSGSPETNAEVVVFYICLFKEIAADLHTQILRACNWFQNLVVQQVLTWDWGSRPKCLWHHACWGWTPYPSYNMKVVTKKWSIAEKNSRLTWDLKQVCPDKNPMLWHSFQRLNINLQSMCNLPRQIIKGRGARL